MGKMYLSESSISTHFKDRLTVCVPLPRYWTVLKESPAGINHEVGLAHVLMILGAENVGKGLVAGNESSELLIGDG